MSVLEAGAAVPPFELKRESGESFTDRDLLNNVVDRIIHIDQGKLVAYGGNYDRFEQVRREQMELQGKAAVKQSAQRAHLQSFVDRFRANASKAAPANALCTGRDPKFGGLFIASIVVRS